MFYSWRGLLIGALPAHADGWSRAYLGCALSTEVPTRRISAAPQTYRTNVSGVPHCGRIRTFMLPAWLREARLTAVFSPT
jgi:hypothetical protein